MMKLLSSVIAGIVVVSGVTGSSWFPGTKAAYNKWHETELERWLTDHDIPHPRPSDRKDLQLLVDKNWNNLVIQPYSSWDAARLNSFLRQKGKDTQDVVEESKDNLVAQVQASWYETEDAAQQAWSNTKDWILDSWSDSQLKSFCDKHGIPAPQPRHRDTLLQKARYGYESVAQKLGETTAYPGNWLYQTWSDSDLKSYLDRYGIPAPQPTNRDKLIAAVRRNSRLASLQAKEELATVSASAKAAYATLTDMVIDAWGESQLKEFCDKNRIQVPQGTKLNELRALVRKHRAEILGDTVGAQASSVYGAATSKAGNEFAKATHKVSLEYQAAFDGAVSKWSHSRLKSYLDARGVPVPHGSKADEMRALIRKHAYKASTGWSAWTFDDLSRENLKNYLEKNGDAAAKAAAKKRDATRDELLRSATSAYASASKAGGSQFASATSYLSAATAAVQRETFDAWSHSDLKAYLDGYGVPVPQGSKLEELKALARRQSTFFKYGTSSPSGTILARIGEAASSGWDWISTQMQLGRDAAEKRIPEVEKAAAKKAKEIKEEL